VIRHKDTLYRGLQVVCQQTELGNLKMSNQNCDVIFDGSNWSVHVELQLRFDDKGLANHCTCTLFLITGLGTVDRESCDSPQSRVAKIVSFPDDFSRKIRLVIILVLVRRNVGALFYFNLTRDVT